MSPPRRLALVLCLGLAAGPVWADTALVIAANANVRAAPGTGSNVVATLRHGARLEVLGASGEWLRVRVVETKVEGWVHRRLVEVAPAASSAPAPPPVPPAPAKAAATPAPEAAPVSIDHRDVGCVIAGQYPKLDACFSPDASVGRGRVLFRAAGSDPWYYVEMTKDGPCYSGVLPKPKPELKGFEYFVDVVDKSFAETHKPDRAPEQAFAPRVVKKQGDCDPARKMALFLPRLANPIMVGVALDPSGSVLTAAAAKVLESKALLAGFSSDGVVVSSTGAAPGAASSSSTTSGSSSSAAAHSGIPKIALVGGAVAAAAVVAVVAAGGGGGGSSSSSASSSPNGGSGGSGGSGGAGSTVAGQWVGSAASGRGLMFKLGEADVSCTFTYDITLSLTPSGGTVGGNMTYAGRTHTCTVPDAQAQEIINGALASIPGDSGGFPVSGSTNNAGNVTLTMGGITFSGGYNATSMDLTGSFASNPGLSQFSMTMKLVR
jgi:SH3 domain-containing protein